RSSLMLFTLLVLIPLLFPLLLVSCVKKKPQQPKTLVQQSSGNGSQTEKNTDKKPQQAVPPKSGGRTEPTNAGVPKVPASQPRQGTVAASKKNKEQPSSGSLTANKRVSAKQQLSKSKTGKENKKLLMTPIRQGNRIRSTVDNLEAFTCEDQHRTEEHTQATVLPYSIRLQYSLSDRQYVRRLLEERRSSVGLDGSLVTCQSEHAFDQAPHHVMGNVDEIMEDYDNWQEYIGDQLHSNQSVTCDQPSEQDRSAVICGHYRIWLSEKIGSQADQPPVQNEDAL
ncbi:hypothetical protein PFISCL1PPCAC_6589, partial [Pristionchus fissidentatus]